MDKSTPSPKTGSKGLAGILSNPMIYVPTLLGVYLILTRKPKSKVARTIGVVRNYGRQLIETAVETGTEVATDLYSTGQDIFDIYDNEAVVDIDAAGEEGADPLLEVIEDPETTEVDGYGFDGGTSRMSRGFDGTTMDHPIEY